MGRDICVRIIKKDRDTNTWKQIKLYYKEKHKFKSVNIYPFRNYELFDILNGDDENFKAYPILMADVPTNLQQEIKERQNNIGYYGFREITLAELKLYLYSNPKIRNYDYDDDDLKAWQDNPIKNFIERIEQYLNFTDSYWYFSSLSDIKIIYWFNC